MKIVKPRETKKELARVEAQILEVEAEKEFIKSIDPKRTNHHEQQKLHLLGMLRSELYAQKHQLKHWGKTWE